MDGHQIFEFAVDTDTIKWVAISARGRGFEISVRYTADVVLDEYSATIPVAIDPEIRADEVGLIFEWKQPIITGWDWLTFSRRKRF